MDVMVDECSGIAVTAADTFVPFRSTLPFDISNARVLLLRPESSRSAIE